MLDTGSTLSWEGGPLGASSWVTTVTALVGEPRPTLLLLNTWRRGGSPDVVHLIKYVLESFGGPYEGAMEL